MLVSILLVILYLSPQVLSVYLEIKLHSTKTLLSVLCGYTVLKFWLNV